MRFAPSAVHPKGIPDRSVTMLHFQPSLDRSTGLLPVPSSPTGALCKEPSIATSPSRSPITLSNARSASFRELVVDPRGDPLVAPDRTVVSETLLPQRCSAFSKLQPVASRTSNTSK